MLWDYIMMEWEILDLYWKNLSTEAILQEKIELEGVMKEQPRKMGPAHFQLLRLKLKWLKESMPDFANANQMNG